MSDGVSVRARTIHIFLSDGTPTGVLTAEIINWTGKIIAAPRARLPDLLARPEASRTGAYILSGPDPQDATRLMVYVGESDSVRERLKQHNTDDSKDFFTRVCVIVSKDENLTKTHVRYLESRLIDLIKIAKRAVLANGNSPMFALLPESDKADMEFFIEQIAVVLPVLGLEFIQPTPTPHTNSSSAATSQSILFDMTAVGIKADAVEIDGEFVVLKGSLARLAGTASWTSYKGLRDKLVAEEKLIESGQPNILQFAENVAFDSPSAAAAVVYAGNQNGRIAWRVKGTNQSYKEWQDGKIDLSIAVGAT